MVDLLYANDLVLCGESEEDLKVVRRFVEVCRRGGLISNEKSMVMVLGGEERL